MKKLIKSLSVCLVILFGITSVNAATLTDRLNDGHKLRLGFGTAVPWADAGVTVYPVSSSTQTFSNQSPDTDIEVTDMVKMWFTGSVSNYGMLIRFNGAQETNDQVFRARS